MVALGKEEEVRASWRSEVQPKYRSGIVELIEAAPLGRATRRPGLGEIPAPPGRAKWMVHQSREP